MVAPVKNKVYKPAVKAIGTVKIIVNGFLKLSNCAASTK
ncbi:MAG: Uncharacterised protein [Gammaproteobacteria bacterium]|nr:MAG: Uncharacterised protein [Gammaproteobacteria bacterium]